MEFEGLSECNPFSKFVRRRVEDFEPEIIIIYEYDFDPKNIFNKIFLSHFVEFSIIAIR